MIRALRRWHLRRLIAAGEAHIAHAEAQIVANRADVAALRVRLALLEAPQHPRGSRLANASLAIVTAVAFTVMAVYGSRA